MSVPEPVAQDYLVMQRRYLTKSVRIGGRKKVRKP
tara:strand:+ start:4640 stop:4744 length:105 start_codon:yes stop_codon:yes gene_type:complete